MEATYRWLTLRDLEGMTGIDRRRLGEMLAGLSFREGPKGAKLYDSRVALAHIFLKRGP